MRLLGASFAPYWEAARRGRAATGEPVSRSGRGAYGTSRRRRAPRLHLIERGVQVRNSLGGALSAMPGVASTSLDGQSPSGVFELHCCGGAPSVRSRRISTILHRTPSLNMRRPGGSKLGWPHRGTPGGRRARQLVSGPRGPYAPGGKRGPPGHYWVPLGEVRYRSSANCGAGGASRVGSAVHTAPAHRAPARFIQIYQAEIRNITSLDRPPGPR